MAIAVTIMAIAILITPSPLSTEKRLDQKPLDTSQIPILQHLSLNNLIKLCCIHKNFYRLDLNCFFFLI